ncbi:MAG: Asp-tRNA(Asn)/Glu-tRNA(Gln) amidotransferase subunit GatA [Clostridia bacterium]|nr:Asp-tRNA(Asn)/Glu-tRNA(Gln) amidotransferase subunit GatA [Clostridia bacterium]
MPITDLTLQDMAAALADKQFSSLEATEEHLQRIGQLDPQINAFISVTAEQAIASARAADQRRAAGQTLGPLDGIPMALKDIICSRGVTTTCASRILANYVPPYNATCWQRLEDAGAVLLGKLNMDEFAMGSSTETSAYGACHNPFDLERVPGGSSGGSAAAVAADLAVYALGTDSGGSIRQPAHFCGVVGFKPTYGRVSRYGVIPYASSLDQVSLATKTCFDAALALRVIAGQDKYDSTSAAAEVPDYTAACSRGVKGLRVGVAREFSEAGIEDSVLAVFQAATARLIELGAQVEEISLPHTMAALPAYYVLASAEASSNLARYDGVRYGLRVPADNLHDMIIQTRSQGFGAEAKRRIMLGTYALSSGYYDAYYNKTLQVRTLVKQDYDQAFAAGYDCILTPPAPSVAFRLGENTDDPLTMYMQDVCTVPVNLAGLPAIVVPRALDKNGLPIGVQLIGAPFGEDKLFAAGAALETLRLLPPLLQ